jgi:hypothetical protein
VRGLAAVLRDEGVVLAARELGVDGEALGAHHAHQQAVVADLVTSDEVVRAAEQGELEALLDAALAAAVRPDDEGLRPQRHVAGPAVGGLEVGGEALDERALGGGGLLCHVVVSYARGAWCRPGWVNKKKSQPDLTMPPR